MYNLFSYFHWNWEPGHKFLFLRFYIHIREVHTYISLCIQLQTLLYIILKWPTFGINLSAVKEFITLYIVQCTVHVFFLLLFRLSDMLDYLIT